MTTRLEFWTTAISGTHVVIIRSDGVVTPWGILWL